MFKFRKTNKESRKQVHENEVLITFSSSLISILIGLLIGFILLMAINFKHSFLAFGQIVAGGLNDGLYGLGFQLAEAAPLILVGLSITFAFKTGLFNIGAAGQYTVGAFFALFFAIVLKMPWYVNLLAAIIGGALWGSLPGILKAYFNVNEVISSIMFNWIGLYAVNELIYNRGRGPMYDVGQTKTYSLTKYFPDALIPSFGMHKLFDGARIFTIAIFLAIIVAILINVVLEKTTFGYDLKACGYNRHASKYAGINEKKYIVLSMLISGGLAGMAAGLYYLSGIGEWAPNHMALPVMGFNGISVALLGALHPVGAIFSGIFISHITNGGYFLNTNYFSVEIANVITGVIIYLSAFSMLFKRNVRKLLLKIVDTKNNKEQNIDSGSEINGTIN